MERFFVGLVAIIITGCATVYPECEKHPEESEERATCQAGVREWREGIDRENWRLCQQVLRQHGVRIYSDHTHGRKGFDHAPHEVKSDLSKNSCKMVLRDHWADY